MDINPLDVVEVRVTWERVAASPWAGCRLVGRVKSAEGVESEVSAQEANDLAAALRAAGARLVEGVEGNGRVVRVTSDERRVGGQESASEEAGVSPAIQPTAIRPRPASIEEALEQMVAQGAQKKPGLVKRLDAAAGLVKDGRVALVDEGEARVGPYRITVETCTCADFTHRGGWCKHRLATRMARHLVRHGFELPRPAEVEKCPQVSAKNLALIASGRVVDEARRRERAYQESGHGARDKAMRMLGNGAATLPADLARKAGVTSYEQRVTSEEAPRTTNYERRMTNEEAGG